MDVSRFSYTYVCIHIPNNFGRAIASFMKVVSTYNNDIG